MSEYTFSTLAPNEFEDLCKDLLERHLDVPLQAFTTGRDGGIDLRHAPATGRDWVVQCKHYAGSRFADLKKAVVKEVKKLGRLKPSRYILATSCGLTPDNVDALYGLLRPYCISKQDIFSKNDLNGILRNNGDVEQHHPKLWITSEAVLNRVVNNDVFVQSALTREAILRRLSLYVHTARFDDARKKLTDDRVCIISGVPGVGKTTLAEMLIVEHLMDGWELVTIHQNISEGLRALRTDPKARQVFYYDDFLGQTSSGEKLAKNEDGALLQLIRAVQQSHTRRFILTTREYILAHAKREHEKLARASLDVFRFVVECRDYDEDAKARILANHLYFNEVPQKHIEAVVKGGGYRQIIDHENYNPRLIESMTSRLKVEACAPSIYLEAFLACLDDPSQIWEHIYQEQLSEASRQLLLAVVTCSTPVLVAELERAFEALYSYRCRKFGWTRRTTDFERSLNDLEDNFIRIREQDDANVVECHNPSVLDFLSGWLNRHCEDVEDLLRTATTFQQIEQLMTVTVPLPSQGTTEVTRLDEVVLADAVRRTTLEMHVSWTHLQSIVRLCGVFVAGGLRTVARLLLKESFDSLASERVDASAIISLLDTVKRQGWIPESLLSEWRERLKACILFLGDECVDEIGRFVSVSKWVAGNKSSFSEAEYNEFQRHAAKFVDKEADASVWPDTEDYWAGVRYGVEQLQKILQKDFRRGIEAIERNIENADKPDQQEQGVTERITKPQPSSIDSIFESLLV